MTFSFDTEKEFDRHIDKSIPNYSEMTEMSVSLIEHLIHEKGVVIDFGCSTGNFLAKVAKKIPGTRCIGYDISQNLLRQKKDLEGVELIAQDVTKLRSVQCDCAVFMFTLQFLPPCERLPLLKLVAEGCDTLIVTEKTYIEQGRFQEMYTFSYYDYKSRSFTPEELFDKQKSIRRKMKLYT